MTVLAVAGPAVAGLAVPELLPDPPVTVTISIAGGATAGRDRILAVLRDLVDAAGPAVALELDAATAPSPEGQIHLDPIARTALRDGSPLELSRLEFDLLLFLARHPRQVFSRTQLLSQVWGHTHTTNRTVDVHVSRLRTKLDDPDLVTTVYGLGYRLADDAAVAVIRR
jgi:DNA-binding response OmpR family regulator